MHQKWCVLKQKRISVDFCSWRDCDNRRLRNSINALTIPWCLLVILQGVCLQPLSDSQCLCFFCFFLVRLLVKARWIRQHHKNVNFCLGLHHFHILFPVHCNSVHIKDFSLMPAILSFVSKESILILFYSNHSSIYFNPYSHFILRPTT